MFTCSTEHLDFSSLAFVLPFMITNQKLWKEKVKITKTKWFIKRKISHRNNNGGCLTSFLHLNPNIRWELITLPRPTPNPQPLMQHGTSRELAPCELQVGVRRRTMASHVQYLRTIPGGLHEILTPTSSPGILGFQNCDGGQRWRPPY